jgi:hypothetical protein
MIGSSLYNGLHVYTEYSIALSEIIDSFKEVYNPAIRTGAETNCNTWFINFIMSFGNFRHQMYFFLVPTTKQGQSG